MKKAVILLSGGLDTATVLAIAKKRKFDCYALTVDYNQKHGIEINSAKKLLITITENAWSAWMVIWNLLYVGNQMKLLPLLAVASSLISV